MPLDRERTAGLAVAGFALLTRAVHAVGYAVAPRSELYYWPVLACRKFEEAVVGLLQGAPPSGPFVYSSALYRYFMLPFYATGVDRVGLFAFQSVLGVITAWLLYRTTRLAGAGRTTSVTASVAWCLYAPAAFVEFTILPVAMMALLLTLFAYLLMRARTPRKAGVAVLGLVPGILAGLRPPFLLLFGLPLWKWLREKRFNKMLIAAATLLIPLLFLSWQQMNSGGGFYPFPRATGLNLVLGHSADASGYGPPIPSLGLVEDGSEDIHQVAARVAAEHGATTPAEADAYWSGHAMEHIRSEPLRELELLGIKYAGFFGPRQFDSYYEMNRTGSFNPVLRFFVTPRWLICGLFLITLLPFCLRGKGRIPVLAPVILSLGTSMLLVHAERFFLPVLPLILVSTAAGAEHLIGFFRKRSYGKGLLMILVGAVLLVPVLLYPVPTVPEDIYIGSLAVRAYNMGDYGLSLELFERQAVLAPRGAVHWVNAHMQSARIARALGMEEKADRHDAAIAAYIR